MKIGQFHFRLGLRTVKTALSVAVCLLFYHFTHFGSPMVTAIAAVFALRENISSTYSFGKSRIIGNTLGGVAALTYFALESYASNTFLLQLIGIPLLIILIIVFSDGINNNTGIIGSIATFLIIALSGPTTNKIAYAIERVVDTFIGTFIAIGVNSLIKPPKKEKIIELVDEIDILEKQITKLEDDLNKAKKQRDDLHQKRNLTSHKTPGK